MNDLTITETTTVTLSVADLETLIRRVVREELSRAHQAYTPSIVDDWSHEGPLDPDGDEQLLEEAITVLTHHPKNSTNWHSWEAFEKELDEAEARGELPD